MTCAAGYTTVEDVAAFLCITDPLTASTKPSEMEMERYIKKGASRINVSLMATGMCSCTFNEYAAEYLQELNLIATRRIGIDVYYRPRGNRNRRQQHCKPTYCEYSQVHLYSCVSIIIIHPATAILQQIEGYRKNSLLRPGSDPLPATDLPLATDLQVR